MENRGKKKKKLLLTNEQGNKLCVTARQSRVQTMQLRFRVGVGPVGVCGDIVGFCDGHCSSCALRCGPNVGRSLRSEVLRREPTR